MHLLGPEGSHDTLASRLMRFKEMTARPAVVLNYLAMRRRVREAQCPGLELPPAPSLAEVDKALHRIPGELAERARKSTDTSVEDAMQRGSDVGNVRTHASDGFTKEAMDYAADAEAEEENSFELPPDEEGKEGKEGEEGEEGESKGEGPADFTWDRIGLMNCATSGDAVAEAAMGAVLDAMKVSRAECACSEFSGNGRRLMEAFWYLFPLQRGLQAFEGTIPTYRTKHLMQHLSNRFQRDAGLVFVLANQVQRHTVLKSTNMVVRQPRAIEFVHLANDPAFLDKLKEAYEKPRSKTAREVMRKILPLLASSARPVPWGAIERGSCIGKLVAMIRRFGPPSLFLTIKPDDVHDPLTIRLTIEHLTNATFPALPGEGGNADDFLRALLEGGDRFSEYGGEAFEAAGRNVEEFLQRQAAHNPASTSMTFDQLMRTVLTVIVGTPLSDAVLRSVPLRSRVPGFFGLGLASFTVVEETGNGSHHMHTLSWGGAMPALCSGAASDAKLFDALRTALDRQYRCEVPLEIHVLDAARRAVGGSMYRSQYHKVPPVLGRTEGAEAEGAEAEGILGAAQEAASTGLPGLPGLGDAFRRQAHLMAVGKQMHVALHQMEDHQESCHKPPQGEFACRMCAPFGHPVKHTRCVCITGLANAEEQLVDMDASAEAAEAEPDAEGNLGAAGQPNDGGAPKPAAGRKGKAAAKCNAPPTKRLSIDHQLPYSEITCSTAPPDPSTPDHIMPSPTCWPRHKSLLNTGDLWLSVTQPAEEEAARRSAARGKRTREEGEDDEEEGEESDEKARAARQEVGEEAEADGFGDDLHGEKYTPGRANARLVPRDVRSSIVIELRRPMLTDPWLEKAAKAEGQKAGSLQSAFAELYEDMPTEVRTEMERPEWAQVKARLKELTVAQLTPSVEAAMARVVKAWARVPCANSVLTAYNEVLTAVLGCNTAPYLLGSRESSRAACFYLVKCFSSPNATLSLARERRPQRFSALPLPLTQVHDQGLCEAARVALCAGRRKESY